MKKSVLVLGLVMVLSAAASADVVLSLPDLTISNASGSGTFDVSADFSGAGNNVGGFMLDLLLLPRTGASGITFTNSAEASSNFIFTGTTVGWSTAIGPPDFGDTNEILGDDSRLPPRAEEFKAAGSSKGLITVTFNVAPSAAGVYDLVLDPGLSDIYNGLALSQNPTFRAGTITVTQAPEPATLALLALGGLGVAGRIIRRRGVA